MEQKKVFSGNKPVLMQINNSINRLQEILDIVSQSDKDPEVYLKNQLFIDELEATFILQNTYLSYGEYALDEFQTDFVYKVLTIFKSTFPQDDISLETLVDDMGLYFIRVTTTYMDENIPILNIFPYFKTFEIIPYARLDELDLLCKEKEEELSDIQERINMLRQAFTKPAIYAGDNVKLFIQLSNKKKREQILNEELVLSEADCQRINNEIFELQTEIEDINNKLLSVYIVRDRFIDRLKNRYKYISLINETIENNLEYNTIENTSENLDSNKNFFTTMINEEDEKNDNYNIENFSLL